MYNETKTTQFNITERIVRATQKNVQNCRSGLRLTARKLIISLVARYIKLFNRLDVLSKRSNGRDKIRVTRVYESIKKSFIAKRTMTCDGGARLTLQRESLLLRFIIISHAREVHCRNTLN